MSVHEDLQKLRIDKSHKASRNERSIWPWVVVVLLVIGGAFGFWQWRTSASTPEVQTIRVRVIEGQTSSTDRTALNATGYVMAAHKIELASKAVGRVAWVGIEMGDKVEKDQVLARLEDDEFKARVAQQQGQLDAAKAKLAELEAGSRVEELGVAKAMLEKAQVEAGNAERNFKRLNELASGAASRQEIDDAEALFRSRQATVESQRQQYEMAKAGPRKEQIEAQRGTVRQLEGALAMSMIDLSNTVIRSPIAATVLSRNVEVGEFVTTGFVGDLGAKGFIVSIADLNDLRVELDISQNDFAKVAAAQSCRIVTDAYPDKKYQGVVDLISPEANRQKATVQVRVKVLDPDALLKPDMNATVSFLAKAAATTQSDATAVRPLIRVPATAIREGGVFVVENGNAVRRPVVLSENRASGGEVEVLSGLIGGEDVIISPPISLQDGGAVRTLKAKS
jgi:HlyD family secretion protein